MTESSATPRRRWRDGIHPGVVGSKIASLARVELPLGDAIRVEMVSADAGGEDVAHVQYYICTEAGGWALWISCPRGALADLESSLQAIPPLARES
jgi:hypothetical protein